MKQLLYVLIVLILFSSCTKQVDTTVSTIDTTGTNTGNTSTVAPKIKFFNVMDYGPLNVLLNNNTISSSLQTWYPTTYKTAVIGTNSVIVKFGGDTTRVNITVDLLAGKNYSCFIYRVGYNWKISLVPDNFTTPTSGNTAIRLLDFRTQAYFTYINLVLNSAGTSSLTYNTRNFLDHQSYSYFTTFSTIPSGNYTYTIFDNSSGTKLKSGSQVLLSTNVYTLILMSKADLSPTDALNNIQVDCEANY